MVKGSNYRHVCVTESPFLKCQNSCDEVLKRFDYLYSGNVSVVCPELLNWDSGIVIKIN